MALTTVKFKLKAINTNRLKTLRIPSDRSKTAPVETLTDTGRDGVNGRIRGRRGVAIRASWLASNPLCVVCLAKGVITAGQEVDHVQPLWAEGEDDSENKQTLCIPCHRAKSKVEYGMRWRGQKAGGGSKV